MAGVSIEVGKDLIAPIVEAKIQAAIVEALNGESSIVGSVVAKVLTARVRKGEYSNETWTMLESICHETIVKAARGALERWAAEHQKQIEAELLKQIKSKGTVEGMAKQFLHAMVATAGNQWRMSFNVTLPS